MMGCYAIRGATSVPCNGEMEILDATRMLLGRMCTENEVPIERIVSVIFTVTKDLNAVYPARAAREIGWSEVPLLCTTDMEVPGSVRRCVRVLMHVGGDRPLGGARHVYLGEARTLRPDWAGEVSP